MPKRIISIAVVFCLCMSAHAFESGMVDIHGFVSQGYLKSSANNTFREIDGGTFDFNELGINFTTRPTPRLRIGVQLFAQDIGDIGNDALTVDWALADYQMHERMGIRVGKMKAPLGLYNEFRDIDAVRTPIFLPQSVYLDFLRDSMLAITGAGVYGEMDMSWAGTILYQALGGGMNLSSDGGTAQGVIALGVVEKINEIEVQSAYAGNVKWRPPVPGLVLGLSGNAIHLIPRGDILPGVPLEIEYDDFNAFVYSAEYTFGDLVIAAELNRMFIDYKGRIGGNVVDEGLIKMLGWYVGATYRLTHWLEAGLTYSEFYDDADDKKGALKAEGLAFDAWQKQWSLAFRFDLIENWILKLEGQMIDGTNLCLAQYNTHNDYVRYWHLWAVKVTYVF